MTLIIIGFRYWFTFLSKKTRSRLEAFLKSGIPQVDTAPCKVSSSNSLECPRLMLILIEELVPSTYSMISNFTNLLAI